MKGIGHTMATTMKKKQLAHTFMILNSDKSSQSNSQSNGNLFSQKDLKSDQSITTFKEHQIQADQFILSFANNKQNKQFEGFNAQKQFEEFQNYQDQEFQNYQDQDFQDQIPKTKNHLRVLSFNPEQQNQFNQFQDLEKAEQTSSGNLQNFSQYEQKIRTRNQDIEFVNVPIELNLFDKQEQSPKIIQSTFNTIQQQLIIQNQDDQLKIEQTNIRQFQQQEINTNQESKLDKLRKKYFPKQTQKQEDKILNESQQQIYNNDLVLEQPISRSHSSMEQKSSEIQSQKYDNYIQQIQLLNQQFDDNSSQKSILKKDQNNSLTERKFETVNEKLFKLSKIQKVEAEERRQKALKEREQKDMEACTFKPTIFTRSRSVHKPVDLFFETKDESKGLNDFYKRLVTWKDEKLKKLKKMRKQKQKEELKACEFKPDIKNSQKSLVKCQLKNKI